MSDEEPKLPPVLSTVQKFEASNFVFKTPLNTDRSGSFKTGPSGKDSEDSQTSTPSPPPSSPEPPPLPDTDPPESGEDHSPRIALPPDTSPIPPGYEDQPEEMPKKGTPEKKKGKKKQKSPKTSPAHEPDLNKVPKKSSLKKVKLPPRPAPPEHKGIWFNMQDQYPVEDFGGREQILEQIHEVVHGQKSRDARPISRAIVLVGPPGAGKTEIARKFAFKFYVDCSGKGNVVWMDGTNKGTIVETLLLLLDKELLPRNDPYADPEDINGKEGPKSPKEKSPKKKVDPLVQLKEKMDQVIQHRVFQDHPTLFIFDNAMCEEDILEFIPHLSPFGHIPNVLVTSGQEMSWNNARVLKVGEFEFKEAVDFLQKLFQDFQGFTRFQAEDLVKELHRFPPLLQKARKIVLNYLNETGDPDRAILRLEKNIGLVRRLKGEEILETKIVEQAVLATDRGIYHQEDPYIREYDGELRNHEISMQIHQLEAIGAVAGRQDNISVLAVNHEPYILAMLVYMIGKESKILAVYDNTTLESSKEGSMEVMKEHLNNDDENLMQRIEMKLIEIPATKSKQPKTSTLFSKIRAGPGKEHQYDLIICSKFVDQDLDAVKKLLLSGGYFITLMSSVNVQAILKKVDPKKLQIKIMKHDFPELLVIVQRL